MALGDEGEFSDVDLDNDNSQIREAIKTILEEMAKSSPKKRKALLDKIIETVDTMDIGVLNRLVDNEDLKEDVNKKIFMKYIKQALKDLKPGDITNQIIENALLSVSHQILTEVNKSSLDKLGDAFKELGDDFKELSIKEKIGVVVVAAIASPLIVLAVLIVLVVIGVRYAVKEDGMAIGAGQKETVEQKVNEKVDEMNPSAKVGATKTEQVDQRTVENSGKQ